MPVDIGFLKIKTVVFFLITEISELGTFYLAVTKINLREKWFVLAPSAMVEPVMVGKP